MSIKVRDKINEDPSTTATWNEVTAIRVYDSVDWQQVDTAYIYTSTYGWKVVFPDTPTVILNSQVGFKTTNSMRVIWTSTNQLSYMVLWQNTTNPADSGQSGLIVSSSDDRYTITGLTLNTEYSVTVRVYNNVEGLGTPGQDTKLYTTAVADPYIYSFNVNNIKQQRADAVWTVDNQAWYRVRVYEGATDSGTVVWPGNPQPIESSSTFSIEMGDSSFPLVADTEYTAQLSIWSDNPDYSVPAQATKTFTTATNDPSITFINVNNIKQQAADVVWTSENQAQYRVQVFLGTVAGINENERFDSLIQPGSLSSNTVTANNLVPGEQHIARVRIWNSINEVTEATKVFTTALNEPSINSINVNNIKQQAADLVWTSTNQAYYRVRVYIGSGTNTTPIINTDQKPGTITSYTMSGLSPDTFYTVQLSVWDNPNYAPAIQTTQFTTATNDPIINSLVVNNIKQQAADVVWTSTRQYAYRVRIYEGTNTNATPVFNTNQVPSNYPNSFDTTTLKVTATGLTNSTGYTAQLTIWNNVSESTTSTTTFTTVTPPPPATVPNSVSFSASSSADGTQIYWSWSAPYDGGSPITSYGLQRSTSPSVGSSWTTVSASTFNFTNPSVSPGTTYYLKMKATNSVGDSAISYYTITTNAAPAPPPPPPPPPAPPPTTPPPTTPPPTTKTTASLGPETKVLTEDYGYIEIKYLSVGDKLVSLDISEIPISGETFNVDQWSSETFTNNGYVTTDVISISSKVVIGTMVQINGEWFTDNHNILVEKDGVYSLTQSIDIDETYKVFDYDVNDWVQITQIAKVPNAEETVYIIDCEPYDVFFTQNALVYNRKES